MDPVGPVAFPLSLRIPAWAGEGVSSLGSSLGSIRVNGRAEPVPEAGSFARIERTWRAGDRVELTLPLRPRVKRWFNDSAAVERGPLVFSYGIGEDWVKLRDRGMTADWQVFPKTQWNYALEAGAGEAGAIQVAEAEVGEVPFSRKSPAITLTVTARKTPAWLAEDGVAAAPPKSPVADSAAAAESVALIPYAAAKLRITAFPVLKA